jgi:hypothetical protein
VPFDTEEYRRLYVDIAPLDENQARQHWISSGYYEGRFPFDVKVNQIFYTSNYRDLEHLATEDECMSHFVLHGYSEGRLAYFPHFDHDWYLQNYQPIIDNWIKETAQHDYLEYPKNVLERHFIAEGYKNSLLPYRL